MQLHGKYDDAIVHTNDIEQEAISQIINMLNHPISAGKRVRIMPDVHAGESCI
jgi:molybdopterin converting factor small subunit